VRLDAPRTSRPLRRWAPPAGTRARRQAVRRPVPDGDGGRVPRVACWFPQAGLLLALGAVEADERNSPSYAPMVRWEAEGRPDAVTPMACPGLIGWRGSEWAVAACCHPSRRTADSVLGSVRCNCHVWRLNQLFAADRRMAKIMIRSLRSRRQSCSGDTPLTRTTYVVPAGATVSIDDEQRGTLCSIFKRNLRDPWGISNHEQRLELRDSARSRSSVH
jgi:hypothetical protein